MLLVADGDGRYRARLQAALGAGHPLLTARGWKAVAPLLERHAVDALLLDIAARGPIPHTQLAWLHRQHPHLATVMLLDPAGREADLFRLASEGVDEVVLLDDGLAPGELVQALERALVRATARRAAEHIRDRVPQLFVEGFAWAIEHADRTPNAAALAEGLARPLGSYRRALRRAGLPSPTRILLWGRLVRAGRLLAGGHMSVEAVAHRLGYAAGSSLSRALRRETGHPPSVVRERGGMITVLDALLASGELPV